MKHPIEESPHYARYLYSEALGLEARRLYEAWTIRNDQIPVEVQRFIYDYFWNDRGKARGWFAFPGLNSFPHQVHPDTMHPLEFATYAGEATEILRLVSLWCELKKIPSWNMADLANIGKEEFLGMRKGDFDSIARYIKAVFDWWDVLCGPRALRENLELNRWIEREREITRSLRWKVHSTLVRLKFARRAFPEWAVNK